MNDKIPTPIRNGSNLSSQSSTADWQRPAGVSPGTWDYVQSNSVADGYDEFLRDDPLTSLDWKIIDQRFQPLNNNESQTVVEFGCGTGRTLLPLSQRGYKVVGIDLSARMLASFSRKFKSELKQADASSDSSVSQAHFLKSNLVELDGLKDNVFDGGICLFSTLGMIRGRKYREKFLQHARRTISDGGQFVVHAHSLWAQALLPGGMKWILQNGIDCLRGKSEFGDRLADYRSVRDMFIHSFRKNELAADLQSAGFAEQKWFYIVRDGATGELSIEEKKAPNDSTIGWIVDAG